MKMRQTNIKSINRKDAKRIFSVISFAISLKLCNFAPNLC